MLEMSTATREPPELIHLMNPILPSFNLRKMRMIHITPPHIVSAARPSYGYLIILGRRYQAK